MSWFTKTSHKAINPLPEVLDMTEIQASCTHTAAVARWRDGHWVHETDELAVEAPVALVFNGVSHAVMLATPNHLTDFARGFALSEGIVPTAAEFYSAMVASSPQGHAVHCTISDAAFAQLGDRRRNMAGRTGCGLCGVETLDQVLRPLSNTPQAGADTPWLAVSAIRSALSQLASHQPLNGLTGGMHAAAWCDPQGDLELVCEDVGRHNALDKLIGRMAEWRNTFDDGFLLISSRASVEMIQKAATVGIRNLVAISAPTALAVATAEKAGMTLIAFARGDRFVGYTHLERILTDD